MLLTALVHATIFTTPDAEPIRGGVVLVDGDSIAEVGAGEVPRGAAIVDCSGMTIAAGFWNSHVHFFERKWAEGGTMPAAELGRQLAETFTRYGFTSVFDLGSMWTNTRAIRDRIESGQVAGPSIRSTGAGLVPPGAMPSEQVLGVMGVMNFSAPEVTDAATANAACRKLLDDGVDGIKLFASAPRGAPIPSAAIQAAADAAHLSGKLLFVHPNSNADVMSALGAGADIVAHTTPRSAAWDEALLALMQKRRAALTPTLNLWKFYLRHDRVSMQDQIVRTAAGQLRAWHRAGGSVLFGTDLGAVDADPTEEYALMAEGGMDFRQILASLTTEPASRFGESNRLGRLAPGMQADLAVLRGDPQADMRALVDVEFTMRAGKIVYRR